MIFEVKQDDCLGCGVCLQACPTGAIALVDGKAFINQQRCKEIGRASCRERV